MQFLAIDSSGQDAFISLSAYAQERNIPFPVLKDFDQQVADDFGASRTPESFLLDAGRVIRYRGRIDDQYGVGFSRIKPTSRDLAGLLTNCWPASRLASHGPSWRGVHQRFQNRRAGTKVTYARDVAAIIQKRCQECHRPGEIGPFSFLTYEDAAKRTSRIREAVLEERMPPWHADPRYGHFANDRRLSQDERDTFWRGSTRVPQKAMTKTCRPRQVHPEGWKIGEPDKVFAMAREFRCRPAACSIISDSSWTPASRTMCGSRRPNAARAIGRWSIISLVYILAPGQRDPYDAGRHGADAGGLGARRYAGGCMRPTRQGAFTAGSKLLFEVHYTPNGTEQTDRSSVGIRFAKTPPANAVEMNILANMFFRVPPGAADTRAR